MEQSRIEKAIEWLKENPEEFVRLIEELDSWNGYLCDDRYYDMGDFDELHSGQTPWEISRATYYGEDEDGGEGASFCPARDYYRYNAYGNLASTDFKDYSDHLDDDFVEELNNNQSHVDIPTELKEIMEEGDEDETA